MFRVNFANEEAVKKRTYVSNTRLLLTKILELVSKQAIRCNLKTSCLTVNVMSGFACFPRVASGASPTSPERIWGRLYLLPVWQRVFFFLLLLFNHLLKPSAESGNHLVYLRRNCLNNFWTVELLMVTFNVLTQKVVRDRAVEQTAVVTYHRWMAHDTSGEMGRVLLYSILFYSILFYSTLLCRILFSMYSVDLKYIYINPKLCNIIVHVVHQCRNSLSLVTVRSWYNFFLLTCSLCRLVVWL